VAGATDSFAALLGSGVRGVGDAMVYYGSSGTGAQSETWRSIMSDMTRLPQTLGPTDASARGAAFIAALGTGDVDGVVAMRDTWLATELDRPPTRPDPAAHERYLELLPSWLALDAALSRPVAREAAVP
jgi:sugar (pentulose or hexulose) kinase